ncbi:MAG TPA: M20/M25/M40 family metallo-hydrolase [Thermoanaerobaculia bacterium]|jgi:acetylornithine deacetylase|nr:M20/M25/M40 family metallo-hydrolase [Thermoanaerobaculia bacterium]
MSDVIALLKELIAIDSVNPSLVPGGAGEAEIAQRIADELRSFGASVEVQEVAPKRVNVVGIIEAKAPGRSLMLCGHSDTVGVEGMTAPFDPVERDRKLYGRGAQDMKGGVAAILAAARTIAEKNLLRAGKLVIAMVADEEHASLGAEHLVRHGIRCDAAIICEPTDLAIGVGHKGFEWVEVETHGVAAHGSRPDEGVDAIVMMGRVLTGIEELDRRLAAAPPHPLLGRPSVHASLIRGGRELSTYPDRCTLSIERRTVEGEREGILLDEVRGMIQSSVLGPQSSDQNPRIIDPRTEDRGPRTECRLTFTRRPYITPDNCELLQLLPGPRTALSFWTDAAIFGNAGTPTVVYGPGGAGLHGIEEYVRIDEVLTCRDVLVDLATRFCTSV